MRLVNVGFALVMLGLLGSSGCKQDNVGVPCDVGSPVDNSQAEFNGRVSECSTGICLKPAVDPSATMPDPPTGALCSADCSQDSDCEGETRDSTNASDRRCLKGFACGAVFVRGPVACRRLCVCRDFLGPTGLSAPPGC